MEVVKNYPDEHVWTRRATGTLQGKRSWNKLIKYLAKLIKTILNTRKAYTKRIESTGRQGKMKRRRVLLIVIVMKKYY